MNKLHPLKLAVELVELAGVYAEDGAFLSAADRLRKAADVFEHHHRKRDGAVVRRKTVSTEECDANARLIAAAPELLAVCEEILAHPNISLCECGAPACLTTRLRAAIAKARGDQP